MKKVLMIVLAMLFVIVSHEDESEDIYGTITHNRARGVHLLEPMKKIIQKLIRDGTPVEVIGKQLGMSKEEVFRLSDISRSAFLDMLSKGNSEYSKAAFILRL